MGDALSDAPKRLGRYELVLPLSRGEGATAYLARASGLGGFDRYVVVKVADENLSAKPTFAKRLTEEAKLTANLRHNNVLPVYDVGQEEARVFLVVEYLPGDSLEGLLRLARESGEPLPVRIGLRILSDALGGLHAVHEHADDAGRRLDLVYGRLSPASVLVGTDGIARLDEQALAEAAGLEGGARYAPPEKTRGEGLDRRADVWAAGAIAWELLTGRDFTADVARDPPRAGASDAVDAAIANALAPDRELRTKTAASFAAELLSAARSAGMLAEPDEVAEHVKRLASAELAARRERLAAARGTDHAERAAEDVRTVIGMGAPPPPAGPAEPPLEAPPDKPSTPLAAADSPLSVLALDVDLSSVVSDRARESILGSSPPATAAAAAAAAVAQGEPAVYASPVGPPGPPGSKESKAKEKRYILLALAGAGLLLVVLAVVLIARGPKDRERAGAAMVVSGSGSEGAEDLDGPVTALHITANGPIATVAVGPRTVEVTPGTSVNVDLLESERGKSLRVFVTSTDGRVAMATADPGVRGLDVVFGDRPGLPPPPPPPDAAAASGTSVEPTTAKPHPTSAPAGGSPKEKRTWPKRRPKK